MSEEYRDTTVPHWRESTLGYVRRQAPRLAAGMLISSPIVAAFAAEHSVEAVSFEDTVATLPAEISLQRKEITKQVSGSLEKSRVSTLDLGALSKVDYSLTGTFGIGLYARATGPPEAGGTLASYVDPTFLQTNLDYIGDPGDEISAYEQEVKDQLLERFFKKELLYSALLGAVLWGGVTSRYNKEKMTPLKWRLSAAALVGATALSCAGAYEQFNNWSEDDTLSTQYSIDRWPKISFDRNESLEIARQIEPAFKKNQERMQEGAKAFEKEANASFDQELLSQSDQLMPREGESLLFAEADPQGSKVGTAVRTHMYERLADQFPDESSLARIIAGDFTSNGTIGELRYAQNEVRASGDIDTVVSLGDHDSDVTAKQLKDSGAIVPNLTTVEVNDLRILGATDPERKTLFGGLIENKSGVSEEMLGERLRLVAEKDKPDVVVVHQPDAAASFLGIDDLAALLDRREDVIQLENDPPASVTQLYIGHTHVAEEPKTIIRTDGSTMTIDQLGSSSGWENRPIISRFSTADSPPLKDMMLRVYFMDTDTNAPTGYVTVSWSTDGICTISDRVDLPTPSLESVPEAETKKDSQELHPSLAQ